MIAGQIADIESETKSVGEEGLYYIEHNKTGCLLTSAYVAGGYIAGADDDVIRTLEIAGFKMGTAFQIQDDILDVTSTAEVLGKPVLSDEKNSKTTYVTLEGLEKAKADVKEISERACETLAGLPGEKEFLSQLIEMLVNREN